MNELDVTQGLKKKGMLIVNTNKKITKKDIEVHIVDASTVAMKLFKKDIVNTAMLGAFAAATKLVSLESLNKGIEQRFKGNAKMIELNKKAIKEVYNKLK
jgi:pyruvate ferredoxin oxidoreductase gamma subunit